MAHWTNSKDLSTGVQSRPDPCPQSTNENEHRHNLATLPWYYRMYSVPSYNVWWTLLRIITGTWKFDHGLGQILHDELHWLAVPDRVFFKLAVTVHRCLNGRAPPYLSDYCVQAAGVDIRRHLRSANCQLHAVPRYRLNTYGRRAFSVACPIVWYSLPDFIRDPPSVQTVSDDCLKRTCSLNTSAFSALKVLDDNRAL